MARDQRDARIVARSALALVFLFARLREISDIVRTSTRVYRMRRC